jgi:hypothetical protein
MVELDKRASINGKLSPSARARIVQAQKRRWQKIRETFAPANKPPRATQPPCSPLRDKLVENIGRQLRDDEASFVRQVQTSFANARVHKLTETDLGLMAGRGNSYDCWKQLDLWHDFPPDDFYFWVYVAWELRRRNWKYPHFIAGITDFHLIEPAIKQWEHDKAIEQWNKWFREFDRREPVSEPGALELRLAVGAEEARLQWRSDANAGFAELKRAQARRVAEQFEKGALAIAPDSLPLWSAAYRPWRYESWWLSDTPTKPRAPG